MSQRIGLWASVALGCVLICGCDNEKPEAKGGSSKKVAAPLKPKGPPSAFVAAEKNHNFGSMDQQQKGTHAFEIRNEGEGELELRIVDSTCGCTEVKLGDVVWNKEKDGTAPTTIVPVPRGSAINLDLTWDTKLKSGPFNTTVSIETNDPKQLRVGFVIEGTIVPFIELSQTTLKFDDARNNEETKGTLYIYSKKVDNLEITDFSSSNPLISAEFEPAAEDYLSSSEAKCGLKANIKIAPGLPIGPFDAVLTMKTNCEARPEVSVSVRGQVGGDVRMNPADRIIFGTVKSTESTTRPLFLKFISDSETPVEVKEPKITLRRMDLRHTIKEDPEAEESPGVEEPNFLKITLKKAESQKNFYQLRVEVPKGSPGGQFRGLIELETDHPTAKLVKIPVSVQIVRDKE